MEQRCGDVTLRYLHLKKQKDTIVHIQPQQDKPQIIIYDETKVSNTLCLSSITQADCALNEVIVPYGTKFGCPGCSSKGKPIKEICSQFDEEKCQFGLTCNDDGRCDFDRTTCAFTYYFEKLGGETKINLNTLPTCDIDGTYAAVQCKGDRITGRCFCHNFDGKRIFGWAWRNEITDENPMKCACSRLKYKMESQGLYGNTMHCDHFGNFEELQCNDGICWCANKLTGELQNKTRVVPENMWKLLPCYDPKYHAEQYLRPCESIANSQFILKKALYAHGTTNVEFNNIQCDYDGAYGPIKNMDGKLSCQWIDGTIIGSFAAEGKQMSKMFCNCARDQKVFVSIGLSHRLKCDALGNYVSNQNINGKAFCVDRDGFAVNEPIETNDDFECSEYIYYEYNIKFDEEYVDGEDFLEDNDYYKL